MEITEISLAVVTADFLDYLRKLEGEHLDPILVTDFLVIASKLVLIKSRALLPSLEISEDEELDIKNLEARLKIYAEFKLAKDYLRKNWSDMPKMSSRVLFMSLGPSFYPPSNLKKDDFVNILATITNELQRIFKPVEIVKTEIINLKKKIEEIIQKLTSKPTIFKDLAEKGSRNELVVIFLAILHLIKDQLINVEQAKNFHEITIVKKEKVG